MKRFVGIGIVVLALGGVIFWRYKTKVASVAQLGQSAAQRKNAPANVVLAKANGRQIKQVIQTVGSVQSPFDVKISPKTTGIIQYLTLREGDAVKTGQIVARVDSDEIKGQVVQAEAALAEAQQRFTQAKLTQGSTNTGVYAQILQQTASLASTEAEYNQSAANYNALAAAADSSVADAQAKVNAAEAAVQSAQAQLRSAHASLDNSQSKYNRTYALYKQGFVAAQDVDDARTAYEVQQAQVNVSEKALSSAQSALSSANSILSSTQNQASITKLKGKADVQAAKALVTQSKASLKNAAANKSQIPAYVENLRALQSQVDAAKAGLVQAQARLNNTVLRSPIDGTVTSRTADPGAIANPGTAILEVQYLKWLYVAAPLPVEQSSVVHVGMDADIQFDALPGRKFMGKISRLNPSADSTNRQFMIYVQLDNTDQSIRPGMFATVSIITGSVDADVVVPREAVKAGANGQPDTVTVVDSTSTAHIVPVQRGVEDATGIQILSGVEEGQRVVVQSYAAVREGQKVTSGTGKGKGKKGGQGASGGGGQPNASGAAGGGS